MSDFKLVNVTDANLEDITSELTLPVVFGTSSNNFQTFNSQSTLSTTQLQFNIQVPSMSTAVSRHFLVRTDVTLKINFATQTWANNATIFSYGKTNSLQAFPFNSLITSLQSNINTATVSVTTADGNVDAVRVYTLILSTYTLLYLCTTCSCS
jgi:hypothetical protein